MNEAHAAQAAAIRHRDGPALVIAGPGSGKTFTIVKRLENLITEYHTDPSSILTLTYTNAAAKEMRQRSYSFLNEHISGPVFGTFHSVFFSILKHSFSLNASNILKADDKYMILCDIAKKTGYESDDMSAAAGELSAMISGSKNGVSYRGLCSLEEQEEILRLYNARLKERRLLDFDDMILKCRTLFEKDPDLLRRWRERYRYIQVDEFQDINPVQYEVLKLLAGEEANIFAVGDDDQSIYGFRGAGPGMLQRFILEHPGIARYELAVNFRCCAPVAEAADKVIALNGSRIEKHHSSFELIGEAPDIRCFRTRAEEITAIVESVDREHPGDQAVLVRTNELAELFADELGRRGIRVSFRGRKKSFYSTETGKDILAYIRLASGHYDRADILRVVNRPMRYISREAFGKEAARVEDALGYYGKRSREYQNAKRFAEDIKRMAKLQPADAIRYLINVAGYGDYMRNSGNDPEDLQRIAETAGRYRTPGQWLKAVECELTGKNGKDPGAVSGGNGKDPGAASGGNEKDPGAVSGGNEKDPGAASGGDKRAAEEGLAVMTLHASKGLEFREVFIVDVNEGTIPYHRAVMQEELEEERRLFYVGMTRAAKKLHLFYIGESLGKSLQPSSFLSPIQVTGGALGTGHGNN